MAERRSLTIKRVFQGVASLQDQITLFVARGSKVETVISNAAERRFPALYCLIRMATGERLDERKLIDDYALTPGEVLELRRVRRVQNVGSFYFDALAPAIDVHTRPDVVKPTLVDETVPVTRVIDDLAVKLELEREGELFGLFPVPPPPGLAWHGLDPDATLREVDPHAAVTLVLRPILLRNQPLPAALLRDFAASRTLLSTALQRPGAAPVPLALSLGSSSPILLRRLIELLYGCDPTVRSSPQLVAPAWLWTLIPQEVVGVEGGGSPRNMYQFVRCLAEAASEKASRFDTMVRCQDASRRLFLLAHSRSQQAEAPPRLAALHSDLLVCIFRHLCSSSATIMTSASNRNDDTGRLVRWVMSNGDALRRRLWSHVQNRHTSLAKRDKPD